MKKKCTALILALALVLTLAACGGAPKDDSPGTGAPETTAPGDSAPEESAPQKDVDLRAFYDSLLSDTEWPQLMPLEGEALDSFYPGLSDLSLKQCLVNTAAITAAVGEIALVEVENESDVQAVQDIFQARVDYQVGDDSNPGAAWYPETIEGWKTNSRIAANGTCVMLVVSDSADAAVESFNALFA